MQRCYLSSSGKSLLELLIATTIGLSILLALTTVLSGSVRRLLTLNHEMNKRYAALRLQSLTEQLASDFDTYALDLPVRIHHAGRITYVSGDENPLGGSAYQPSPFSEAVTALRIAAHRTMRVIQTSEESTNAVTVLACSIFPQSSYQSSASYVGITLEGATELLTQSVSNAGRPGCFRLSLRTSNSMLVQAPSNLHPAYVRVMLPIESLYTYFIDISGNLRMVSHRGEANLENQPVLELPESTKLNFNWSEQDGFFSLTTELQIEDETKSFYSHSRLARKRLELLLLNIP